MANYIYPAPGTTDVEATLTIYHTSKAAEAALSTPETGMLVPSLQDITVNAANDIFSWTQLDAGAKKQIATTATNSLSMNLVLNKDTFFGDSSATANSAENSGILGLSTDKTRVQFDLYTGDENTGTAGKYISGFGYVTGLAPTVSADAPVWVSPITITVDSDYTVSDSPIA